VTIAAGTLQGTIGFGFAVLSVPVLALLDPRLAPVPQMLIELPLAIALVLGNLRSVDKAVWWVLLGRIPGAAAGWALWEMVSQRTLDAVMGGVVLIAVLILRGQASIRRTTGTVIAGGVVSGVMSYVCAIGGPPLALLYRDAPGPTLRGTLNVVFSVGMGMTLAARAIGGHITTTDLHVAAWLMPAVVIGFGISRGLSGHVEGDRLRRAVLLVASVAALGLLLRAVRGT
jgi:uncharacterized membrane protein YfcA